MYVARNLVLGYRFGDPVSAFSIQVLGFKVCSSSAGYPLQLDQCLMRGLGLAASKRGALVETRDRWGSEEDLTGFPCGGKRALTG